MVQQGLLFFFKYKNMKNVKETVGIDVSKLTLDVHLHKAGMHQQFGNDLSGFKKILAWVKSKELKSDDVLFCFEHTGWYCGLVPFPYQSGTSINGRSKIHPISDRKMKSLLSMSAISAIQHDKELKMYYTKRVAEGKPKMLVLNIIRNKLVSRIFATVNRGTPFVELNQFVA